MTRWSTSALSWRDTRTGYRTLAICGLILLASWTLVSVDCGNRASDARERPGRGVFVLALDGMDPNLTRGLMAKGRLPNLSSLAAAGSFRALGSTIPAESPVAWASFATGQNPGGHGVFGFLRRSMTYAAESSMPDVQVGTFVLNMWPWRPPSVKPVVMARSFWEVAAAHHLRPSIIAAPMTFPPTVLPVGFLLSGFPLPDLRNTLGTYSMWTTDASVAARDTAVHLLAFRDGVADSALVGPKNPIAVAQLAQMDDGMGAPQSGTAQKAVDASADLLLSMRLEWVRRSGSAVISLGKSSVRLRARQWSDWVPVEFRATPFVRVRGTVRFFLVRADEELVLYGSPVNFDPRAPLVSISSPASFSEELERGIGLYGTLGWAESADKALKDGRLDDEAFLEDAERAMDDRERMILWSLQHTSWDLFVCGIETLDRVSHMMWRFRDEAHPAHDPRLASTFRDAIDRFYERADQFVGRIREMLPPGTLFIIVSDHGFAAFRRQFNVNTWLAHHGYIATRPARVADMARSDLTVDWARSVAYGIGLGQVYINLAGREQLGIVSSGDYGRMVQRLRKDLLEATDSATGTSPVVEVHLRDAVYRGPFVARAPDLILGLTEHYRIGWLDATGLLRPQEFEDNTSRWSGDHCGLALRFSEGVLFMNRKISDSGKSEVSILDIAPTVLVAMGLPPEPSMEGRPLVPVR